MDMGTIWGSMLPKRQFEMAYSYTGRLPDPDMSTHYLSPELKPTTNFPGYANAEVDRLPWPARQPSTARSARRPTSR
jgi:hypothetical protein